VHDLFGLMQRAALFIWLACIVALAIRLLRVGGTPARQ
jgi:hypothetical protein